MCIRDRVCEGAPEVNEALLTGEAASVQKQLGDDLMSGSFLVAGTCLARLTRVGEEAYAAQLVREAKKPTRHRSEMMNSLDKLVRCIGILLAPLGICMFLKQFFLLHTGMNYAVTSTVAAVIGMVPEGLYLLTSVALALGVLILARRRVLVHELSSVSYTHLTVMHGTQHQRREVFIVFRIQRGDSQRLGCKAVHLIHAYRLANSYGNGIQ